MFGFTKDQIWAAILIAVAIWWYRTYRANKTISNAQTLLLQADPFTSGAI